MFGYQEYKLKGGSLVRDKTMDRLFNLLVTASGLVAVLFFAGWVTHLVVCLQDKAYVLLIAGALAFPVGIVHGIGCWFGVWG